jgi:poly-gamma-glutamate synthesis protein (capsule biosynthesis protein)
VVQPIRLESVSLSKELQKEALVAYSLGNFISGQTKPNTDGGILLEVVLEKDPYRGATRLVEHGYIPCYRYRERDANGKRLYSVLPISPLLQGSYKNLNLSHSVRADMQAYRNHVESVMQGSDGKEKNLSLQAFQRLARKASTQ